MSFKTVSEVRYEIDWDRVVSLEEVIRILKKLRITFNDLGIDGIGDLVKETL